MFTVLLTHLKVCFSNKFYSRLDSICKTVMLFWEFQPGKGYTLSTFTVRILSNMQRFQIHREITRVILWKLLLLA